MELKNVALLALVAFVSSFALAGTPNIQVSYGEPGPTAGTGFGDLQPLDRSAAKGDVLEALNKVERLILSGLNEDYPHDGKTRLVVDVAAEDFSGPVYTKDGELLTEFRVRLSIQRHRAVFEHKVYRVSAQGNAFQEELLGVVQGFMNQPRVASYMRYDANQALALK